MSQQNTQSKLPTMKPLPVKEMRYGEKPTKTYKIPKAGKQNGAGWGGEPMKKTVKKAGLPSKSKVMKSISKSMGY